MGYGLAFQLFYMEGRVPGRWSMPFLPLTLVWTLWKKGASLSGLYDTRVLLRWTCFETITSDQASAFIQLSLLLDLWRIDGFSAAKSNVL